VAAAMPVSATATPSQAEEDREERLSSAEAALEGRDLEQALSLFKEGAAEAPNQAVWLRGEAETLYAQGHFEEARAALDQALSLTPDDPELKRMHDRFYPSNLDTEHAGGSPWGAMLRSMVLPGWGQFYNGQSTKGKLVCAVTLGLLAATAVTYIETDSAIAHYRSLGPSSSQSDFDSSYNTAYDYAVANDILGVCFYSAYAWNVFDAATHAVPPPAPAQSAIPRKPQLTLLAWQF
jgi:tetratricopeptide (TPR) repeat protein